MCGATTSGFKASSTYCTAGLLRIRDKEPQYGFTLNVPGATDVIWLTDVEQRNGLHLWNLHGRRTAPHYCLTSTANVPAPVPVAKSTKHAKGALDVMMMGINKGCQILTTQEGIRRALKMASVRLTAAKHPGPTWSKNSCHLDTFLLSELAFYTAFGDNIQVRSDIKDVPPGIRRLWKVLATLGSFMVGHPLHQDVHRDAYREYELSLLTPTALRDATALKGVCDYRWHGDVLNSTVDPDYIRPERLLGCGVQTICSEHGSNEQELRFHIRVPCPTKWWPMSDGTARRHLSSDEFNNGHCGVQHSGLTDVLLSHLSRPSGDHTNCYQTPSCKSNPAAYQTHKKFPLCSQFPRSLEFDIGRSTGTVPWDLRLDLQFGRLKYKLVSITFQSPAHYVILVHLRDRWWFYDDLYEEPYVDRSKGKPTLREVPASDVIEFAPGLFDSKLRNKGFAPRTWRYALDPATACAGENAIVTDDSIEYTPYSALGYNDPALLGSTHNTSLTRI